MSNKQLTELTELTELAELTHPPPTSTEQWEHPHPPSPTFNRTTLTS